MGRKGEECRRTGCHTPAAPLVSQSRAEQGRVGTGQGSELSKTSAFTFKIKA